MRHLLLLLSHNLLLLPHHLFFRLFLGLHLRVIGLHHLLLLLLLPHQIFLELVFVKLREFNLVDEVMVSLLSIDDLFNRQLKRLVMILLLQRKLVNNIST